MVQHSLANAFDCEKKLIGKTRKKYVYSCGCGSLLIVAIISITVSLKKLTSTELGVEYDTWTKQLDDAATQGEPTIFSKFRSVLFRSLYNNDDGRYIYYVDPIILKFIAVFTHYPFFLFPF